jgi:hypothetical protein
MNVVVSFWLAWLPPSDLHAVFGYLVGVLALILWTLGVVAVFLNCRRLDVARRLNREARAGEQKPYSPNKSQ